MNTHEKNILGLQEMETNKDGLASSKYIEKDNVAHNLDFRLKDGVKFMTFDFKSYSIIGAIKLSVCFLFIPLFPILSRLLNRKITI